MTPGRGSVVVSSTERLGGIVQIHARNQTPSQGAYIGLQQGSSKFYVPIAARRKTTASGLANSQIIIQNADSTSFNVTVDLILESAITYTKTINNLAPGVSFYYDLEEETNLPDNWIGSAVVTAGSSGKLSVVSNLFLGPDGLQTFNAFPVESAGTKWVAPLFFVRLANGLSTTLTVQNISGAPIAAAGVALDCTKDTTIFPDGPVTIAVSNPAEIPNNASYSFNPVTDSVMFPYSPWGGSCRIDSGSANTVVYLQMRFVGVAFAGVGAYEAIREGTTDRTMVVPLVAKRLSNGFASVVTIQNMNFTGSAIVNLHYVPSSIECPVAICDRNSDGVVNASDAVDIGPFTILAGASLQRNHRLGGGPAAETALPDGWVGSLFVTSSDSPIHGMVQLTNYLVFTGDTLMAHNAFTIP